MTLVPVLAAIAAIVILGYLWRRDQQMAQARRDAVFDACASVLHAPRIIRRPGEYPRLEGFHHGHAVILDVMVEALAVRKLPSLWLFVTMRAERPGRASLDMLMRPIGVEFYAPSDSLPYRLDPPQGWPRDVHIRTDDPAHVPGFDALAPAAVLLHDPRAKEIMLGRQESRIVWQAAEGRRDDYLMLRQARFASEQIDPALVARLLGLLTDLASLS